MSGTIVEKFFRQTENKLVYRFNIESGVEVGDGSTPGVVTNNSKTSVYNIYLRADGRTCMIFDIRDANKTLCCCSGFQTARRHGCKWNIQEQSEWSAVCTPTWIQSRLIP